MHQYAIVYEKTPNNWGAYAPDLPGCVAVAATLEQCQSEMALAIQIHIQGLKEDGLPIPEPTAVVGMLEVAA